MPARGRRLGAHGAECRWLCWRDRQHERPADLQLQRWARVRIVLRPAFAGPVLRLSAVLRLRPLAKRVAKAEPRPRGRGSVPFVNRRLVAVPVAVAVPVGIATAIISAPAAVSASPVRDTHPPRDRLQWPGTGWKPGPQPPATWTMFDDCCGSKFGTAGAAWAAPVARPSKPASVK